MQIEAINQDSSTQMDTGNPSEPTSLGNNHHDEDDDNHDNRIHEEDALLEKLLELAAKLEADQNRKPSHQKPQLQAMWQEEITELKVRLGL